MPKPWKTDLILKKQWQHRRVISQTPERLSMHHLQRTREYVEQVFQELDKQTMLPLRETALIRDGHYCGHRFSSGELTAVWFFEEDEVKFYSEGHHLVQVNATTADTRRRAA